MKKAYFTYGLWVLIITLLFSGCLKDDELNRDFDSYLPREINDGHSLSTPEAQDMNPHSLRDVYEGIYQNEELWSLRSLLVFRNRQLVAESYLKDEADITNRHLIWSCTKQVMGVLVGKAIETGVINDLNDPISLYFDTELEGHADKADISIHDLLTMRSGIDYENDGIDGETDQLLREFPDNSVEFILDLGLIHTPGSTFDYKDGDPHLLSALIQKQVGVSTDVWADQVLFSPIELNNYNWVRYKDGITLGGFGIETSPRELAKVALCVSDSGRWKGAQVINADWIEEMTTSHVSVPDSDLDFGYLWWIDESRGIHFMWGHGGQYAFIVPAHQLLIVMTSIPNTQGEYEIEFDEAIALVDQIIATLN
jgi:CubicO group peptidase (beta-lactamase class C family)